MTSTYETFLERKTQYGGEYGFEPTHMPDEMFGFQAALTEWAIRKGRAAILADCGLGKTLMQLVWADNVFRHTGRPVLLLTPLAVANQTAREAEKFGIDAEVSAEGSVSRITITNYQKLHHYSSSDFGAVVCDESSILKAFGGATRKRITRFVSHIPYRLLCTATAAPNDYVELGTSSEALGELSHSDMLRQFFRQLDDKGQKKETRDQDDAAALISVDPSYYQKLAYRVAQSIGQWRLKHHAVEHFWRWVASWARACRMPSDLGFDDADFVLPPLIERDHMVPVDSPPPGKLFNAPAVGLAEERDERRRTLTTRCDFVAGLVDHDRPAVVWCHMNDEGDRLEEVIPDAKQIAGKTPDALKIELYNAFAQGELRVLVIKPKIGAWGLNWQHCSDVVTFASHSYEQYYQSIRRCWRFGQMSPVRLDVVSTEGELRVVGNMRKKAIKADAMFSSVVGHMNQSMEIKRPNLYTQATEVPAWLS